MHRLQVIKQIIIPRHERPAPLYELKICPSLVFPWATLRSRPGAPNSPRECFVPRAGVSPSPRLPRPTPIRFPILLPRLPRRGALGGRLGGRNPILCSFFSFSFSLFWNICAPPSCSLHLSTSYDYKVTRQWAHCQALCPIYKYSRLCENSNLI